MTCADSDLWGWVAKQLETAAGVLRRPRLTDAAVHAVRRDIKRARAGVRLLRGALGEPEYRRHNAALREVGGALRQVRDAKVLTEATQRFEGPAGGRSALRELRREARFERLHARRQLGTRPRHAGAAVLRAVARRLISKAAAPMDPNDESVVAGLRHTHATMRKAHRRARRSGSDADLHEWRKQVKYFYNQLVMLRALGRRGSGRMRQRAGRLAELLGEDHDLTLLSARVGGLEGGEALQKAIARRREKLQCKSWRLGSKLKAGSAASP
jgi:CHAD domain-containing protein